MISPALRAALAALAIALPMPAIAGELRHDVGTNDSPTYVKECGSCHFAYQPGWLPERSWRRIMATLSNHFGENAEIAPGAREEVTRYLAARGADHSTNTRSREIVAAIPPGDTPTSITKVLYVGGIHNGFLDPAFQGKPEVKTLTQCPICHQRADRGWFYSVNYKISDESFRSKEPDLAVSMPVPSFLRRK